MKAPVWTDRTVEEIIGELLRIGVLFAGAIVLAGGILYVIQYGRTLARYAAFDGNRAELHSILPVIKGALGFDSRALIQLGVLLLIATPIARVAFSIVAFGMERDWTYVWITLAVFGILMLSLFGPIP
jgi:uncharacterized membrane protein